MLRSTARPGDLIFVTHEVGDAVLALEYLNKKISLSERDAQKVLPRLFRPSPRVHEGIILRNIATSAIDISDGLHGDLQHILEASQVGAIIYVDQIPISDTLKKQPCDSRRRIALHSGDSYELCFTVPKNAVIPLLPCGISCIGEVIEGKNIQLLDDNNNTVIVAGLVFSIF